ncbi:MAG: hypothetical protein E7773_11330 [Sphingomonas sp.]|uniref:hypothetical protein n=1 Tax=Sphingomonas sp. TaxID=28214 RepID=UPI0011FFA122|nr:hypothetical protein [Sphingomonas sp.]THD35051.1 MAG: hypothetical protein E7773_11330 [Sphingomonas sp.]
MTKSTKIIAAAVMLLTLGAGQTPPSTPQNLPKPRIELWRMEAYTAGGRNWVRYSFLVPNSAAYPAEMFASAPTLPPCGTNTKSSRTWVDFFTAEGKRIYGFCALGSPADLNKIWFAVERGTPPPPTVYIEMTDRATGSKYRSAPAPTHF